MSTLVFSAKRRPALAPARGARREVGRLQDEVRFLRGP